MLLWGYETPKMQHINALIVPKGLSTKIHNKLKVHILFILKCHNHLEAGIFAKPVPTKLEDLFTWYEGHVDLPGVAPPYSLAPSSLAQVDLWPCPKSLLPLTAAAHVFPTHGSQQSTHKGGFHFLMFLFETQNDNISSTQGWMREWGHLLLSPSAGCTQPPSFVAWCWCPPAAPGCSWCAASAGQTSPAQSPPHTHAAVEKHKATPSSYTIALVWVSTFVQALFLWTIYSLIIQCFPVYSLCLIDRL